MKITRCKTGNLVMWMLWTILAIGCTSMPLSAHAASADVEASTPYAVIDWPDPLNPNFAALGNGIYLLNTRSGPKVWWARENQFGTARQWPIDRKVSPPWSPFYNGRIFVGSRTPSANFDVLVWWDHAAQLFSESLALPEGTVVRALLPLGEHNVLACLRTGYGMVSRNFDELPTRAVVLEQVNGKLRLVSNNMSAMHATLLEAGVRGDVEGVARLEKVFTPNSFPLVFDTAQCKWEMRNPPAELKYAKNLTVKHHRLLGGAVLVAHAGWYDEQRQTGRELQAPYLWNSELQRWDAITSTGGGDSNFNTYGVDEPVVSVPRTQDFVEFLDAKTLRWTRSSQRLPDTFWPLPAPLDNDRTLVFLREGGRVLVVSPMTGHKPGEFAYAHTYLGEVRLSGAGLLLLGDGGRWYPSNRPELLRVSQKTEIKAIAPLPSPWNNLEGAELRDKTILAFGGLPNPCAPSSMFSMPCREVLATPSYRYFPREDRWEEVPGLRLRFANGEPLAYGNSDIATQWPRMDTRVRVNGDFVFMDGPTRFDLEAQSMTPLVSTLMRWNPTSGVTPLGKLRQARTYATVLELNDQRLVVMGGETSKKLESTPDQCLDCDDNSASTGAMEPTTATEIFDDATGQWLPGPGANFGGGRAVKLANGKIFKLSLAERFSAEAGYRAEIIDAQFSRWKALPSFPKKPFQIRHVAVAGNRVLFFSEKASDNTVLWDDTRQAWRIWGPWFKTEPLSVVPIDATRALIRSAQNYEIANFPD